MRYDDGYIDILKPFRKCFICGTRRGTLNRTRIAGDYGGGDTFYYYHRQDCLEEALRNPLGHVGVMSTVKTVARALGRAEQVALELAVEARSFLQIQNAPKAKNIPVEPKEPEKRQGSEQTRYGMMRND